MLCIWNFIIEIYYNYVFKVEEFFFLYFLNIKNFFLDVKIIGNGDC